MSDRQRWVRATESAQRAIEALSAGPARLTDAAMSLENALTHVYEEQNEQRVRASVVSVIEQHTDLDRAHAGALYDRIRLTTEVERAKDIRR